MPAPPCVSIIINNYNYGKFLPFAIESALNQTYRDLEVIVVDDGSTDRSQQIIKRYGSRVTALFKENGGQASAMNAGFYSCRGDFVIFLDSDDILLPETARLVKEAFDACPNLSKVQYRMEVVDADGRRTGIFKPAPHLPLQSGDLLRHHLEFPFDLVRMATSGNAFPARVLYQIFPIPEKDYGRINADSYICYIAPLFGPVQFLEIVGAFYRIHHGNNFERAIPELNFAHLHESIRCAGITRGYIQKYADQMFLHRRYDEILSVSDAANRMISFKLNPRNHPVPRETILKLVRMGFQATLRRFDVSWVMKGLFIGWFMGMAVAPPKIAYRLAEIFLFPEKRQEANRLLRIGHIQSRKNMLLRSESHVSVDKDSYRL